MYMTPQSWNSFPGSLASYLNFTVSDIYSFASSRGMVFNGKKCKEMCISFLQYCPFPPSPLLVGSSLIEKVSCYKAVRGSLV